MIRQEQGDRLRAMDRIYLNFALGKAYEDKGDYESAFSFYQKGNSLKKIQSRYDTEAMRDELSRMRLICDSAFFAERGLGIRCTRPDFCSGTSESWVNPHRANFILA